MAFHLLLFYCGVWFIRLLRRGAFCRLVAVFYLCGSNSNKESEFGKIMVLGILKNGSRGYFSHYIIKIIGFMSIYFVINLDIVSLFMVFSNLNLESINVL